MAETSGAISRPIKQIDSKPDSLPSRPPLRPVPPLEEPKKSLWSTLKKAFGKGGDGDEPKKPNYARRQGVAAAVGVLTATGAGVAGPDIAEGVRDALKAVGQESVVDVQRQTERKFDPGSTVRIVTGSVTYKPDEGESVKLWTIPSTKRLEAEDAVGEVAKEIQHGQTLELNNPYELNGEGGVWFPTVIEGHTYYVQAPKDYDSKKFREEHPIQEGTVVRADLQTGLFKAESNKQVISTSAQIVVNFAPPSSGSS